MDVRVVDDSGTPIGGLNAADFTVKIDGKLALVDTVEWVSRDSRLRRDDLFSVVEVASSSRRWRELVGETFNDSFADDHVDVIFTDIAFTNFFISSNCTFSLAASKATCSETSPIELSADGPGNFDPTRADNFVEINFLEFAAGPVSDTLLVKKTLSTDPTNPIHVRIVFQSDVDGGPGLTPLSDAGALVFGGVEQPVITIGDCEPGKLCITVISDTEVPEPGSLLLLGSGLAVAARQLRRRVRS